MQRSAEPDTGHETSDQRRARTPRRTMRIALLSTSDTDLLSARASGADWRWANPARTLPGLDDVDLVVVRLLGSPHDLDPWRTAIFADDRPVVVLGGESQ